MSDLDTIFESHSETVWRIIYHLLADDDDARDCYQQTFLDAMQIDPRSVGNWQAILSRIATRRAMDVLRSRYKHRAQFQADFSEPHELAPPELQIQHEELREFVRRALAELPQLHAEAFWLRHIEQLSPAEVASQLGVEIGHVRVVVHRSVLHLRNRLNASVSVRRSTPSALRERLVTLRTETRAAFATFR